MRNIGQYFAKNVYIGLHINEQRSKSDAVQNYVEDLAIVVQVIWVIKTK